MSQLWLQPDAQLAPWEVDARFPYNRALSNALAEFPGTRREEPPPGGFGPKRWVLPEDLIGPAVLAARFAGMTTLDQRRPPSAWRPPAPPDSTPRFPQQLDAATAAAVAPAYLLNFSMGLGKTWSAIVAMRMRHLQRVIVVAPAMAREVWLRELEKHWPGPAADAGQADVADPHAEAARQPAVVAQRPPIKVVRDSARSLLGRKRLRTDIPDGQSLAAFVNQPSWIVVLSYGLLHLLQPLLEVGTLAGVGPRAVQGIVADEIHYLQNHKARWTKEAYALRDALPKAWRCGLTGTAVTNNVDSMWCPLDWLFPNRFGELKQFRWRYMNPVPKQDPKTGELRGYKYANKAVLGGLRSAEQLDAAHAELRERMTFFSSRVTKRDVAHLLPPFNVVRYDSDDGIKDSVELVKQALDSGETHVRVMCYLHDTAFALAEALQAADLPNVGCVSGLQDAKTRDANIEVLKAQPTAVLVATISSTKEAIDLTQFTTAVYTELSPKLVENIQSLGRGHRLSSVAKADVYIVADAKGDSRAQAMAEKLEVLNKILKAGTEEGGMQTALAGLRDREMSDEDFAAVTAAVLENFFDDIGEG